MRYANDNAFKEAWGWLNTPQQQFTGGFADTIQREFALESNTLLSVFDITWHDMALWHSHVLMSLVWGRSSVSIMRSTESSSMILTLCHSAGINNRSLNCRGGQSWMLATVNVGGSRGNNHAFHRMHAGMPHARRNLSPWISLACRRATCHQRAQTLLNGDTSPVFYCIESLSSELLLHLNFND